MNRHIKALLSVLALGSAATVQASACDRLTAEQADALPRSALFQFAEILASHGDPLFQDVTDNWQADDDCPLPEVSDAATEYHQAAGEGDPQARTRLAEMYYDGAGGVEQDFGRAADLARRAAAQGYAPAQALLGNFYYFGQGGVERDYLAAAQWVRRAAEQGDREGQWKLGLLYFAGQGVEQDADKATRWLRLGAGKTSTEIAALVSARSLSENREPTAEKPFWPIFPLILVKL